MRNIFLVHRIVLKHSRFAEMSRIDAAGKRIDRAVLIALRFVETLSAGEDKIYATEKFALEIRQARMRALESRELIHAIVNGCDWRKAFRKAERHRRVVPKNVLANSLFGK